MQKVVGLVRVSKVGGRGGDSFLSPELQREAIDALAEREGLDVVGYIEEIDVSGGRGKRRPGLERAVLMVERGEVAGIAFWRLSRFSRSVRDALNTLARIEDAGGRVWSATEDTDNRLVRTILLAVAEDERDRVAAGFEASVRSAVERGVWLARHVSRAKPDKPRARETRVLSEEGAASGVNRDGLWPPLGPGRKPIAPDRLSPAGAEVGAEVPGGRTWARKPSGFPLARHPAWARLCVKA